MPGPPTRVCLVMKVVCASELGTLQVYNNRAESDLKDLFLGGPRSTCFIELKILPAVSRFIHHSDYPGLVCACPTGCLYPVRCRPNPTDDTNVAPKCLQLPLLTCPHLLAVTTIARNV